MKKLLTLIVVLFLAILIVSFTNRNNNHVDSIVPVNIIIEENPETTVESQEEPTGVEIVDEETTETASSETAPEDNEVN